MTPDSVYSIPPRPENQTVYEWVEWAERRGASMALAERQMCRPLTDEERDGWYPLWVKPQDVGLCLVTLD